MTVANHKFHEEGCFLTQSALIQQLPKDTAVVKAEPYLPNRFVWVAAACS